MPDSVQPQKQAPPSSGQFPPGVSGNPGGVPAGYISAAHASQILATEPPETIWALAKGEFPETWKRGRHWQYVRCAQALMGVMDPDKLTDRMDGPVATKTQVTGANDGPIEYRPVDVK